MKKLVLFTLIQFFAVLSFAQTSTQNYTIQKGYPKLTLQNTSSNKWGWGGIEFKDNTTSTLSYYRFFAERSAVQGAGTGSLNFRFRKFINAGGYVDFFKINDTNNDFVFNDIVSGTTAGNIIFKYGNVGVGTSAPDQILHVEKNGNTFIQLENTGTNGSIVKFGAVNSNNKVETQIQYEDEFGLFDHAAGSWRLKVLSNGNVGIGATGPSHKLSVSAGYKGLLVSGAMGGNNFIDHQVGFTFTDAGVSESGVKFNKKNGGSDFDLMNAYYNGGEVFVIRNNGKVGIGTDNPSAMLTVAGNIESQEVKVTVDAGQGPDYVFEEDYNLRSLEETEEYIKANKHLPEVPSAKVMESEGLNLKEMNLMLLQKIEELTLHQIEQNKSLKSALKKIESLENEIETLKEN